MDKLKLNNQIVLCRPAVRRAKVCLIRKKIKKIKILKSCKKEDDIEKKNKKAERLIEEVQLMKKVRDDDVTKFALYNKDLKSILFKTPANDHDHVYAALANHPDVVKQIEKTKELFPSWETTIPSLLESLGTRSLMKKTKGRSKGMLPLPVGAQLPLVEGNNKELRKEKYTEKLVSRPKNTPQINEEVSSDEDMPDVKKEEEVKVVDSFFVDKKVIRPKLLTEPVQDDKGSKERPDLSEKSKFWLSNPPQREKFNKREENRKFQPQRRPERPPADKPPNKIQEKEEKLHPSWAAKRALAIQPFQGKKIKFDDE